MGRVAILRGRGTTNPIDSKSFSYGGEYVTPYYDGDSPQAGAFISLGSFPGTYGGIGAGFAAGRFYVRTQKNGMESFDITNGQFAGHGSTPVTGAISSAGDTIYVRTYPPAMYAFDTATETWRTMPNTPPSLSANNLRFSASNGKRIYYILDGTGSRAVQSYDPITDSYQTLDTAMASVGSPMGLCVHGDELYVSSYIQENQYGLSRYRTGTWTRITTQTTAYSAIGILNDELHCFTGVTHTILNIASNQWRTGTPAPVTPPNFAYGVNNSLYLIGASILQMVGNNAYTFLTEVTYNQQVTASVPVYHLSASGTLTTVDARDGYVNITEPGVILGMLATPVDGVIRRIS